MWRPQQLRSRCWGAFLLRSCWWGCSVSVCLLAPDCGLGQHLVMLLHLHRWEDPVPCPALPFSLTLASLVAQMVKELPAMQETWVLFLGGEDPWRREWLPTPYFLLGEFHEKRSLAGCGPQGHKELDKTEPLSRLALHKPNSWQLPSCKPAACRPRVSALLAAPQCCCFWFTKQDLSHLWALKCYFLLFMFPLLLLCFWTKRHASKHGVTIPTRQKLRSFDLSC